MAILPFDQRKLNGAFERWRRFIAGFTPGQKTVTVLAGLALVGGGFYFITHSSSPSYTVLFANLQANAAGQVTQQLTSAHVPYELADGGTTVLVPAQDVNQERISLAEAGLPSGGTITFQNLASSGITSSQFVQDVEYQQALSAQLAQAIETIEGVQSAQVQLVVPQPSTFAVGTSGNPSASVLVVLDPGVTLTSTQVQAIVHLTASAVPDLSASEVTVADNEGDVLAAPGVNDATSSDNQETAAYDAQVTAKLTAFLTRIVGPDNAAVSVNAVLDFNQQSETVNSFVDGPNGKPVVVPTSQTKTLEKYTGNGQDAAGTLGAATPPTATNQNGTYSDNETTTNNETGSSTKTTTFAPGQPVTTSVAVILNSSAKGVGSSQNLAQIKSLVAAAAGLDLKAGDSLVVSALPFAANPTTQTTAPKATVISKLKSIGPAAALVLLVLFLFVGTLIVSKRRTPKFEEIPLAELGAAGRRALGAGSIVAELDTGEIPPITVGSSISSLVAPTQTVPADVDGYIQENPAEVASLMRNWSREKSGRAPAASKA